MYSSVYQTFLALMILAGCSPTLSLAQTESELTRAVINAVGTTAIAESPETTGVTRSTWGPSLYKASVDAAVLIQVFETKDKVGPKLVGQGSGVVVSENGSAVTNWHVTWPHDRVVVIFYPGRGRSYKDLTADKIWLARVIRVDEKSDLALLQIERSLSGQEAPSGLKAIPLEDPNRMEVGQDVFSIGHPEGLHWTYTEGVISQIRPHHEWKASGVSHEATIVQTQTVVSFGSSGGPLVNREGKLVGIVEAMSERAGLNVAISVQELIGFLKKQ